MLGGEKEGKERGELHFLHPRNLFLNLSQASLQGTPACSARCCCALVRTAILCDSVDELNMELLKESGCLPAPPDWRTPHEEFVLGGLLSTSPLRSRQPLSRYLLLIICPIGHSHDARSEPADEGGSTANGLGQVLPAVVMGKNALNEPNVDLTSSMLTCQGRGSIQRHKCARSRRRDTAMAAQEAGQTHTSS